MEKGELRPEDALKKVKERENGGKTMGNPWENGENGGKTMHGKTGKTIGKPRQFRHESIFDTKYWTRFGENHGEN